MTESQIRVNQAVGSLTSLGLYARRVTESVVGRPIELASVEQELAAVQRGMVCLSIEGEPGIGKTRLLLATDKLARAQGFLTLAVTADEEIRGPFLMARSVFGAAVAVEDALGAPAREALRRACDMLTSMDDPGLESLPPDQKLMRVLDVAAVACRAIAAERPLAILIDDVQWADEDSVRLLRYVVRANASSRTMLALASRPDELAFAREGMTLLADVERMGLLRRLKLARFRQMESSEFLQQVLGGQITPSSAAVMHAQAEGVPFILAEQAHAYRDAGMLQQIDAVWTLARNAERLLPSGVRTLVERRMVRLPAETKAALAEAAVLGRSFSLRDLRDIEVRLGDNVHGVQQLAEALAPAVTTGLLIQNPDGSAADYTFTHDRVRESAAASLAATRRRAIHESVVQMLTAGGEPPAGSHAMVAHHALAAGNAELGAQASIQAARVALNARAPEEALRLVDLAQKVATSAQDRVALLLLQDDALSMLRRPSQRLEGLAQLAALVEALGDTALEIDAMLRRAGALRFSKEHERAADLAGRVRRMAQERNSAEGELAACLELGQDLLRTELGEGFVQASGEADLDGASEAYERALALAEELGDEPRIAAALRELGIIGVSRIRAWFTAEERASEFRELQRRIIFGARMEDLVPTLPISPQVGDAMAKFSRALDIYERLGDRQGIMSTVIAMAYGSWGPEIHLPGSVKRIEELRRLMTRMKSFTKESERALADTQMLYGTQVYARAKLFPDTALVKGDEAYHAALAIGDRAIELASAGGMALTYAELGAVEQAEQWLSRAAAVAAEAPTPLRARLIESWRGILRSIAGDGVGMRQHLERAVRLAVDQGRSPERCEALARLAVEAARLGVATQDEELITVADESARQAKQLFPLLPGHSPWGAQADAARARVALARGDSEGAAEAARAALSALEAARTEDIFLEVLLPCADALLVAGTEQEKASVQEQLQLILAMLVQRVVDEDVRVQWLRGPIGRELRRLAGPLQWAGGPATEADETADALGDAEVALLRLLAEGRTNREIAEQLGESDESVTVQLARVFAKIGASSRAEATAAALMTRSG